MTDALNDLFCVLEGLAGDDPLITSCYAISGSDVLALRRAHKGFTDTASRLAEAERLLGEFLHLPPDGEEWPEVEAARAFLSKHSKEARDAD